MQTSPVSESAVEVREYLSLSGSLSLHLYAVLRSGKLEKKRASRRIRG